MQEYPWWSSKRASASVCRYVESDEAVQRATLRGDNAHLAGCGVVVCGVAAAMGECSAVRGCSWTCVDYTYTYAWTVRRISSLFAFGTTALILFTLNDHKGDKGGTRDREGSVDKPTGDESAAVLPNKRSTTRPNKTAAHTEVSVSSLLSSNMSSSRAVLVRSAISNGSCAGLLLETAPVGSPKSCSSRSWAAVCGGCLGRGLEIAGVSKDKRAAVRLQGGRQ